MKQGRERYRKLQQQLLLDKWMREVEEKMRKNSKFVRLEEGSIPCDYWQIRNLRKVK